MVLIISSDFSADVPQRHYYRTCILMI